MATPGQAHSHHRVWLVAEEGEDPNDMQVIIPVVGPTLVQITGTPKQPVRNLAFDGITFEHAAWPLPDEGYPGIQAAHYDPRQEGAFWYAVPAAIQAVHAEEVHFSNLTVRHLGGSGLWLGKGTRDCSVSGAHFEDISANGIMIADGQNRSDAPERWETDYPECVTYHHRITGNTVTRAGQQFYGSVGIWAGVTAGTLISGNHVFELPYTGISIGWEWSENPGRQVVPGVMSR